MSSAATREAVKVAIRCRPMSEKEKNNKYENVVRIDQENASVYVKNNQDKEVQFTYDFAYPPNCTQEEIYENTAAPIVAGVLEGINGTIFAYGQTGTGKTYTMDGIPDTPNKGIVPRAFEHIFDFITANEDSHKFSVTVTYVELYNEQLRDLLASSKSEDKPLTIHEDPGKGFVIRGVTTHSARSVKDLLKIQHYGSKHRKVRATNMNDTSSRSHSILSLSIETLTEIEGSQHVRRGRLNLVDLAGSERIAKTGAEKEGVQEGISINYALMILGNCISALTTKGQTHIPYRDSALTKLLRDSLGGNARTLMIANIGPASYNYSETLATLRYAERAKKIENKPKVNMDPKDALLMQYQEELAALQAQLDGNGPAQQANSEEVIKAMEEKLEKQRKQLSEASNLAKEEREKLQKKLDARQAKIAKEKQKQQQYQARLAELNKYLVGGGQELVKRTKQNEAEIAAIREKLKQREAKSKEIERELKEKRSKKKEMISQCKDLKDKVKLVAEQFKEYKSNYENLKIKYPEVQKTIQEDREQLSNEIESLQKQIDQMNQVIDNFIPEAEAARVRNNAIWDEDSSRWVQKPPDKKEVLKKIFDVKRPASANGLARPTALTSGKIISSPIDEIPVLHLKVPPIENNLRDGPVMIDMGELEEEIERQFIDDETDLQVEIPDTLPGVAYM